MDRYCFDFWPTFITTKLLVLRALSVPSCRSLAKTDLHRPSFTFVPKSIFQDIDTILEFLFRWFQRWELVILWVLMNKRSVFLPTGTLAELYKMYQMRLFSRKGRVRQNTSIQISSKHIFYLSRDPQLGGSYKRQLGPVSSQLSASVKVPLVCTNSLRLYISTLLSCLLSPVSLSLSDVIVSLTSYNLSPESDLFGVLLKCKSLNN